MTWRSKCPHRCTVSSMQSSSACIGPKSLQASGRQTSLRFAKPTATSTKNCSGGWRWATANLQRAWQPTQQELKKIHLSGHPHCQWRQDCQTAAQKRQAASPSMTRASQALQLEAPSSLLLGMARVSQARRKMVETLPGCAGCASTLWVITPTSASARSHPRTKAERVASRTTVTDHARPGAREMARTKAQAVGQGGHLHHALTGCQR